jgi:hypothetical protein
MVNCLNIRISKGWNSRRNWNCIKWSKALDFTDLDWKQICYTV